MAILNVVLDTETNNLTVSVNGVSVENVQYVSLSNWSYCDYIDDNEPRYHFSVQTQEKVGDVNKCVSLCASKKEDVVASNKYKGLYEKEVTKASASFDIKSHMKPKE